jgi:hypothetical protein
MKRIESRKAGPPAGLAIFGNEEDLDKFDTLHVENEEVEATKDSEDEIIN